MRIICPVYDQSIGKPIGKPKERLGKGMGKVWERHGKSMDKVSGHPVG
jgi:hypothetical protein